MTFFSVGSTKFMSVLASRSSYILDRASARTLSFLGLCIIFEIMRSEEESPFSVAVRNISL